MSTNALYRGAAVVLVLFAAGHTFGFLKFRPANAEGLAVYEGMQRVTFSVGSGSYTYGGFYRGFGLFATAFLLFSALVAWQIGEMSPAVRPSVAVMAWGLVVAQAVSTLLSFMYFFPAPSSFSVVSLALLVAGALRLGN